MENHRQALFMIFSSEEDSRKKENKEGVVAGAKMRKGKVLGGGQAAGW
jgi:hypothetical protein